MICNMSYHDPLLRGAGPLHVRKDNILIYNIIIVYYIIVICNISYRDPLLLRGALLL